MENNKKDSKQAKETKEELKEDSQELEEKKEENSEETEEFNDKEIPENFKFSGEYIKAIGRRKTSVAQVRMYRDGRGIILINGRRANQYFPGELINVLNQALRATGHIRDLDFSIVVKGGGTTGQVEACRHGIARALLVLDPLLKDTLKTQGFLTRDSRKVERKKPGLKGARKRPQWSKR